MHTLANVTFPIYKIRSFLDIETNPLAQVLITTIKDTYILDDLAYNGNLEERRLKIKEECPRYKLYRLKERVLYLRQLVKYKSGSTFIDITGKIFKYKKSSGLHMVDSVYILKSRPSDGWTILYLQGIEIPFLVAHRVNSKVKYASLMHTDQGPLLYDLTSEYHDPYRRKI